MEPVPERLYKYWPPARADFFATGKIRLTPPIEFNDPFELKPRLPAITPESRQELLTRLRHQAYAFGDEPDLRKHNRLFKQEIAESPHFTVKGLIEQMEEYSTLVQIEASKKVGVFALSANRRDLLMWAHYAENHQGFMVEFDTTHSFFRGGLGKVNYSNSRPIYDPWNRPTFLETMLTKSEDWRNEAEWRIVEFLDDLDPPIEAANGRKLHLLNLPMECVKSVYLGCRITDATQRTISEGISLPGRGHIHRYKAELAHDSFDLRYEHHPPPP